MAENPRKLLVLVDGSSYLYRAFYALPSLTNSKGQPTGAVFGVANMLRRLLADYQPELIAVVFDAQGKTFRDQLFEQYKAHRPPMPEEMQVQLDPLRALVKAMGLPLLTVEGVEADDVIGTLAMQASAAGLAVLISTGDKDMAQLVDPQVTLVNTMTDTVMGIPEVQERFGIPPSRIIDYLALAGDSSDNIPGVPKVGPKTAAKWLNQYGSLDEIIAHAAEIKGKLGENLRAHLDQLALSRTLATIRCDLELEARFDQLSLRSPDAQVLRELLQELEFRSWLKDLLETETGPSEGKPGGSAALSEDLDYQTVLSEEALDAWLEQLRSADLMAIDTETTSLDYMHAELVGISFASSEGKAAYVPLTHDYPGAPTQLDRNEVLSRLRGLLEDPDKPKLGHNLKYDMSVLARYGIRLAGIRYDTMLESYVLDSTTTRHDMDSLALKYLGIRTIHFEDIAGRGSKQLRFNQISLDQAAPYAAEDADVTLKLHHALWPKLAAEKAQEQLFNEIEVPLIPVLSRMERTGVLVDTAMLRQQSAELTNRIQAVAEEAYQVAGQMFNLGSPKQIQEILYARLGLPVVQKTPKGQPSTAESALQDLALDFPLPRLILEHRRLSKLKSTYTDRLPEQVNELTGRVHTSYHQAVATTGRLSSSDPNLQNIPIRTVEGRRIRQAFIAPPGHKLVAADYSQIELRIMAHLSGDTGLVNAFAAGKDIHRATAAEVFGIPLGQVTDHQRRSAKAINFGLIYGMSAFGLARQLGIDRAAANAYIDLYFRRYPGVKDYMERTRVRAKELGFVETVCGRRLYVPEIRSRNSQRRQYAERTAINAPMQGTAADIIKAAMIRVNAWLEASGIEARMIMQVHDELVFEAVEGQVDALIAHVRESMEGAARLSIPLVVEVGTGDNWDQTH